MNNTKAKKRTILAYGFNVAEFQVPHQPLETAEYILRFLPYATDQSLEDADGIIIPSGIFETFKSRSNYAGYSQWFEYDRDHLAKREKEVFQNFQRGGWTAFLLRRIDNGGSKWMSTDLAKKFINMAFEHVELCDPNPHVQCKANEFADYFHDFGICRTMFWSPRGDQKPRRLAITNNNKLAAAEVLGQFFFLPLPSIRKDGTELTKLVTECANAILEYKRRNDLLLPNWVENIEFPSENELRNEIAKLEGEIIRRREHLSKWRRYKGILSSSGNALNGVVVELLRDYFKLDLHSKEEFIEDAIIYESEKPLFVVEIKGVTGGLKRDHVNQVDSHRERLGISPEIPGLLIVNDFTDIDGLAERKAKTFDAVHTGHAEKLNIKILRTTTLIEIIRAFEDEKDRGPKLLQLCVKAKPMVQLPNVGNTPTQPSSE